ncbi:MAG: hypothetical protein ACRDHP_15895, partial [Ktedonobacterales bacterium]
RCTMPITLTSIPAQASFEPTHVTLPTVRKGAVAAGVSAVRNGGEAPLHAQVALCSDTDVSADASLTENGGEVRVRVDTRRLPPGKRYDKWVQLAADGDTPAPRLAVSGKLLPTAWQHIFVKQPLRDRLTLASGAALIGLLVGPLGFGVLTPTLFWILCALLIVGVACGATNLLTRRIVGHIQASGDTTLGDASISQTPLLLSGGATAVLMLILLLADMDPTSKTVLFISLLTLLCGACGFFINEDLAIYPRKNAASSSVVAQVTPAARSAGRVIVVIGGLCLGALAVFVAIKIIIALLPVIIAILIILALLAAL